MDDAVKRNQEKVEIWGDGTARREFMYAGDLADFIIYALNNFGRMPGVLNVGLGEDYTINEYYEMVGEVCGYKGFFERDLSKPVGMKQKLIDDTLLSEFGWKHRYSLKEGLEKTYSYYKSYVQ
ncbi:NAD-dependent epimerase/dehydratase family protein [Niabella hibiscisoli]|uniref:NAD-dependent epimerase/dehydratase family protein n=1 Tax=Niabella hibiscisoli TaxID=1825928 RepID=UPI00293EB15E|nr:NAD-dependent epimerase/dehydratase family protein [Niabella hibiscisoli]